MRLKSQIKLNRLSAQRQHHVTVPNATITFAFPGRFQTAMVPDRQAGTTLAGNSTARGVQANTW